MKWFRFYHEFMDDPKIAMMSDSDQLLWVKALCLASDNEKRRGYIDLADEEICWKLRISTEQWKHAIDKFRAKGMLEHAEGGYKIVNWDKRQFNSDSSAERVAKHREKKVKKSAQKRAKKLQKQSAEVTVTEQLQACNVTVTPPDTDTDTDTDQEKEINSSQNPASPSGNTSEQKNESKNAEPEDNPYPHIDVAAFEAFWKWYKKHVCSISGSNPGSKIAAAREWLLLEYSNFNGIGWTEFKKACGLYLKVATDAQGVGVQHALRFLSGGSVGVPQWLELYQEAKQPPQSEEPDFVPSEAQEMTNPWLTRQDVISDAEAQRIMAIQPAWHRSDEDAEALALYGRVQWEREQAALQTQGAAA
ncbi:MAG: phage replisome organizer N-terminal domain-containing protein [Leptolyngbyaceae cyanobacterium]